MPKHTTPTLNPALFLLPGMESALNGLIDQINQMRRSAGLSGEYQLHGVAMGNKPVKTKRVLSEAAREAISKAQKRRWAGLPTKPAKAAKPVGRPKKERNAGPEMLRDFARQHGNVFDKAAFAEAHPGLHMRAIGGFVRNEIFKKTNKKGVFQYTGE